MKKFIMLISLVLATNSYSQAQAQAQAHEPSTDHQYGSNRDTHFCQDHKEDGWYQRDFCEKAEARAQHQDWLKEQYKIINHDNSALYDIAGELTDGHQASILGYGVFGLNDPNDDEQIKDILHHMVWMLDAQKPTTEYSFWKHETTYRWKLNAQLANRLGIDYEEFDTINVTHKIGPKNAGLPTGSQLVLFFTRGKV